MRVVNCVIVAAAAAGFSSTAAAQTPAPAAPPPNTQTAGGTTGQMVGTTASHWIAAGFIGGTFGASSDHFSHESAGGNISFGGEVGYLWRGIVGGEALADFAPKFKLNNVLLEDKPIVNAYMGNAIAALPLGTEGNFQPYISAGIGAIQLKTNVFDFAPVDPTVTPPVGTANNFRFAADYGGGLMGFAGRVGFRADVRYYRAKTDNSIPLNATPADQFTQSLLSGLHFWRANGGLAFRW